MERSTSRCFHGGVLPFAAVVALESINVTIITLFKAASLEGLSYRVFMAYSYTISTLLLLPPLCYLFHRKTVLPPFTAGHLGRFFVLGLLGFTAQYCGYNGINYTTPTLSAAMGNLIPACTIVLAVLLRTENLALRRFSGQAKIIGTILSITGASVAVLYKGPIVIGVRSDFTLAFLRTITISSGQRDWVVGGALLAAEYVMISVWYIFQSKVIKEYPAEMIVVFFYNLFRVIISIPVCLILEPSLSSLRVPADVRLFSVLYSGLAGAVSVVLHVWSLHMKGPVYVASFRPLSVVIAAVLGFFFLGDNIYLGSVIGSFVICTGFYTVIWGKVQEERGKETEYCNPETLAGERIPFLEGYVHAGEP